MSPALSLLRLRRGALLDDTLGVSFVGLQTLCGRDYRCLGTRVGFLLSLRCRCGGGQEMKSGRGGGRGEQSRENLAAQV